PGYAQRDLWRWIAWVCCMCWRAALERARSPDAVSHRCATAGTRLAPTRATAVSRGANDHAPNPAQQLRARHLPLGDAAGTLARTRHQRRGDAEAEDRGREQF